MKSTGIVTDSHSGITQKEAASLGIRVLPMPFYVDETCYYEDTTLSREDFFKHLSAGSTVSTSQPSPDQVMSLWKEVLEEYEEIVYIPISSGLSGSCDSAKMLSSKAPFAGKVFVVDNGRVSTPLHRSVLDALELVQEGRSAKEIQEILERDRGLMSIYVAVDNLEHLKKGGRISGTTAMVGSLLHIKPVLRFDTGLLETYKKCRGMKKARSEMIEAIKNELMNQYKSYYDNDEIYIVAASTSDEATTQDWVREIRESFPGKQILCDPLSLGVSCHIGENALGIGYSCRPRR